MNSTKDHILDAVRQYRPEGDFPLPEIPSFPKSERPLPDEFREKLVVGAGSWHDVADPGEAENLLHQLHPDARVICSATPEIKGNKDLGTILNPHDLNDVDVGVIRARFGVSETGMVWMTGEDMGAIALGFLSQHLVILLDPDSLVRDMYEAYARVQLDRHQYGCFMLGPSATADIGAYMVHGAQGARSLTVFLMPEA